ncbi:DUF7544 domain-containing protein [Halococcoides cellulosivorans]|uniref:Uncharacterized protein n=1 Tax=Halococcoides cellulosivorans TaxID=1679096 RepID=A0A2R4WXU8_9EURY|nr:hypothetical protein [Halococcoides cellulosivorans]AWB26340.1 hypothetical protein HARCEL1_00685 [Halococcoides cellulosivorans]
MSYAAIDGLSAAIDLASDRLRPVERSEWTGLIALLVLVGQGGGLILTAGALAPIAVGELLGLQPAGAYVAIAVAIGGAIGLILASSIAEFAFIEALRSDRVAIRADARRYLRHGLWLFGFRVVLGTIVSVVVMAPYLLVLSGMAAGVEASGALFVLVWPLVMAVSIPAALVQGFTREFVVPIMIVEDCGPITGWRRLIGSIRASLEEYGIYAVVMLALTQLANMVRSTVLWLTAGVLAVPLIGGWIVLGHASAVLVALGVGYAGLALIALAVIVATVEVPIETALRYYPMSVLGGVSPDLDPLANR